MPQQALEPGAELQWQHGRGGQGAGREQGAGRTCASSHGVFPPVDPKLPQDLA